MATVVAGTLRYEHLHQNPALGAALLLCVCSNDSMAFWCHDDILQQEGFLDSALGKQTPWLWHGVCSARAAS